METNYKSFYLLKYFLILVLFKNSQAEILLKTCLCTTKADATVQIDCHNVNNLFLDFSNFCPRSVKYSGIVNSIDLSENNLTTLPVDLFKNSKDLQVIDLSKNHLQEVHKNIFENLNNLKVLNLSNNKIGIIQSTILPALNILDLSHNKIKDLDLDFHKAYPNLTHLSLSNNYLDDSINCTLTLLRTLYYLDLSYNKFSLQHNEDFNFLTKLSILNLSHNSIESLSNQQFPDNLQELNLGFNFLKGLPQNLNNIKFLLIENNEIKSIENSSNLSNLLFINISGNYIEDVPDIELRHLKIMDLSKNKILHIPETLSKTNFPALEKLILNENPLKNIEFLSHLNLKILELSNLSSVEKIAKNSFSKLNQDIKTCLNLSVKNNKNLQFVDENAFADLKLCYLDLQNNNLSYLPAEIWIKGLKAESGVDLQKNPFHCNCSLQWMINDLVPWLYKTHSNLLDDLRCMSPEVFKEKRMVHWYGWTEKIFCENSPRASTYSTFTLKMSDTSLFVVLMITIFLFIIVIVGIVMKKRATRKRSRMNRRF